MHDAIVALCLHTKPILANAMQSNADAEFWPNRT